jgi:hypothetical protein
MADTPETFRVGDRPSYADRGIPWTMIAPHEDQAQANHSQSLQRLHERGGLSWAEALAVLEDRRWQNSPDAKARVLALVDQWKAAQTNRILKGAEQLRQAFPGFMAAEYTAAARKVLQAVLS